MTATAVRRTLHEEKDKSTDNISFDNDLYCRAVLTAVSDSK